MSGTDPTNTAAVTPSDAPPSPKPHASFAVASDVALLSSDNVLFHVELRDLQRTSSWFRDLFKNSHPSAEGQSETMGVSENSETLEIILTMALGLVPPSKSMTSIDTLDTALRAAEKYEMPGVTHHLLGVLQSLLMRSDDPLRQYGLACRHGLQQLREESLIRCIGYELRFDNLQLLGAKDLSHLVEERAIRTKDINHLLRSASSWSVTNPFSFCERGCCPKGQHNYGPNFPLQWRDFVIAALLRSGITPAIDTILADPEVTTKLNVFRNLACGCGQPFSDVRGTLQTGIDALVAARAV